MAAPFDLPRAEDSSAVRVDEDTDDTFRVVRSLPQHAVVALQLRGVELLEDILVQVALMISAEQVKNAARKHLALLVLDWISFEWRLHGNIGSD